MSVIHLTRQERDACEKIVVYATGLPSQRATALLAVDAGSSQAEAARQSGLTPGQVRYLLTAFTKKRMEIFPEEVFVPDPTEEIVRNISDDNAKAPLSKPEPGRSRKDKKKKEKKAGHKSKKKSDDKKKKKKADKKAGKKKGGKKKKK